MQMSAISIIAGVLIVFIAAWAIMQGLRQRPRSGAHNNWRNEDYLSREAVGSWTEGATYSKSNPKDVSGLGL
jgi:ABC-type nickel/cobalt efflux system permease component RcnA